MLTEDIKREIEREMRLDTPASAHACASPHACAKAHVIEALRIVQRHCGWVDDENLREVADLLKMTCDEVDGVATFYNLLCRRPVGRHVIRFCSSVSCWIMGYDRILESLNKRLGIRPGETTADGRFTLIPNQCLGACDHAPALMIDGDLYQDVNPGRIDAILGKYA